MKTIEIWEKCNEKFEGKALQLCVAIENAEQDLVKVSIRGGRSPFTFRDAKMHPKDACNISAFLHKENWKRVSHFYL